MFSPSWSIWLNFSSSVCGSTTSAPNLLAKPRLDSTRLDSTQSFTNQHRRATSHQHRLRTNDRQKETTKRERERESKGKNRKNRERLREKKMREREESKTTTLTRPHSLSPSPLLHVLSYSIAFVVRITCRGYLFNFIRFTLTRFEFLLISSSIEVSEKKIIMQSGKRENNRSIGECGRLYELALRGANHGSVLCWFLFQDYHPIPFPNPSSDQPPSATTTASPTIISESDHSNIMDGITPLPLPCEPSAMMKDDDSFPLISPESPPDVIHSILTTTNTTIDKVEYQSSTTTTTTASITTTMTAATALLDGDSSDSLSHNKVLPRRVRIRRPTRASSRQQSSRKQSPPPTISSPSATSPSLSLTSFRNLDWHTITLKCQHRLLTFLSTPSHTFAIALALFGIAYFLLFDIRTHMILLCTTLGFLLLALTAVVGTINAGGLLSFLSPTTQHMLLDYNLLELIKISWHSRTLQDVMSLVIFPLTRAERQRIISRLPMRLSSILTRRGIVHLLPKSAEKLIGEGTLRHRHQQHAQMMSNASTLPLLSGVSSNGSTESLLSCASQPNIAMLDDRALASFPPTATHSSPSSTFAQNVARSRSMNSMSDAADAAYAESAESASLASDRTPSPHTEAIQHHHYQHRKRHHHRRRWLDGDESKSADELDSDADSDADALARHDQSAAATSSAHAADGWHDVQASVASTSSSSLSSSSSSSSSSSGSSISGSSTPDLDGEPDVRNFEECTFSSANLSSASRPLTHAYPVASHIRSNSYRAPVSTFLPLPSTIDELNFSNLLDRQIREGTKAGLKNLVKVCAEGVAESIDARVREARAYIPPQLLPYCRWSHLRILVPLASTVVGIHATAHSVRFRQILMRMARAGIDIAGLLIALRATLTMYREFTSRRLHHDTNQQTSRPISHTPSMSPKLAPQLKRSQSFIEETTLALPPHALQANTLILPSFSHYHRLHALPSDAPVSNVKRSIDRFLTSLRKLATHALSCECPITPVDSRIDGVVRMVSSK